MMPTSKLAAVLDDDLSERRERNRSFTERSHTNSRDGLESSSPVGSLPP